MNKKKPAPDPGTALERFKFCPLCGNQEFSHTQENYLQCHHCQFVFYVNPPPAVVAVLKNEKNELLLTQRKFDPEKGKYDFPGGFVEMQESLEVALVREIKEELNLEIENLTYLTSVVTNYPFKGLMYYPVDAVFECRVKSWNVLKIQDDVADIQFLSVFDIRDNDLAFASHKLLVQLLRKKEHENKYML